MATKQGRFQFFTSVMWRNNKFLHNCQDFTILHICHVKKSEIPLHFSDFSPFAMYRNLKFLHMTDFSPHVSHVNYVTNMRYVWKLTPSTNFWVFLVLYHIFDSCGFGWFLWFTLLVCLNCHRNFYLFSLVWWNLLVSSSE